MTSLGRGGLPHEVLARSGAVRALAENLRAGRRAVATGAVGSAPAMLAAAVARTAGAHVLLVHAHLDDAEETFDELQGMGAAALRLPAMEGAPEEGGAPAEQFAERLRAVAAAAELARPGAEPTVIAAPVQALMQLVPAPTRLPGLLREVKKGDRVQMGELLGWLEGAGYTRTEAIEEPGEYSVRGGLVDVFPPISEPVRLDFFGDEVERITEIDAESLASDRAVELVTLMALKAGEGAWVQYIDLLPPGTLALLCETMEVVEQARGYFERITDRQEVVGPPAVLSALQKRCPGLAELNEFSASSAAADARVELPGGALPGFAQDLEKAFGDLAALGAEGLRVVVCCQNAGERQRFGELAAQHVTGAGVGAGVQAETAYLHRGFVWRGEEPTAFVPYHELLNRFTVRRRASRLKTGRAMDTFLDFGVGDYVVHQEHGIAKFAGMTIMKPREVPGAGPGAEKRRGAEVEEYLTLEYANGARLHVPAVQIDRVQKYVGGFSGRPPLSALGGTRWKNQKERVSESVRDLAAELLRVRAAREHMPGIAFPADTAWQREFEAEFPYTETEDQLAALSEIKKDMTRARPMDRLICGDVGFGKTELAIRAAFKAVESGRQVAVLVPTTVLAEQHERTFRGRFAGYPFRIESMSRFKSGKEASEILGALRKGQVDVVIGTHRLLSKDVRFADLGLVIVDEEQRFGVEHKDALLKLRLTVDVLTLSATPIPRTLHMAMLGLRDISSLTTAPLDRRAIVTEVIPYNEKRVAQAIAREMSREGQVFFVHNRVHDIVSVADDVRRLAPDAKIVVGHGQMAPAELEEVMLTFMRGPSSRGGADILVSTTIIESGIDIPTANTIIIKDADRFGLAELHQLRGRVGRSKHRAYCYLLLPPERTVKEIARKRLKAIEQYSMLGAGFKIAMRDLEIRGAGNILGPEQSGHIAAVGYDMYCRLLEEAVKGMSGEKQPDAPGGTSIELGISGIIPKTYIPSEVRRLEAYRRIACAGTLEDLARAREELAGAYGDPPKPTQRLFDLAMLRIVLTGLGVRTATVREKDVVFVTPSPEGVADALRKGAGDSPTAQAATVRIIPPQQGRTSPEVYFRPDAKYLEPETLLRVLKKRLLPPKAA